MPSLVPMPRCSKHTYCAYTYMYLDNINTASILVDDTETVGVLPSEKS